MLKRNRKQRERFLSETFLEVVNAIYDCREKTKTKTKTKTKELIQNNLF